MQKIDFKYLEGGIVSQKILKIFHKNINIVGRLDKSCLNDYDYMCINNSYNPDVEYICLVDLNTPDKYKPVYIGSLLKILLEKKGYKDYEGPIRIYGEFLGINTTKINIGKIWKADILDDKGNIIDSFENEELKPTEM